MMVVAGGWWEGTILQGSGEKEFSKYRKNRWKGVVHQEKGAVV